MRQFIFFILVSVVLIILAVFVLVATDSRTEVVSVDRTLDVVATVFPLGSIAQEVLGDVASVTIVAQSGADPHNYEPSLQDVERIVDADILLGVGVGFDSWAERIADQSSSVVSLFALEGVEHDDDVEDAHGHDEFTDPHFWLDPIQVISYVEVLRDLIASKHPEFADAIMNNAHAFIEDLQVLDNAISTALASCEHPGIIVSHDAYGHLATRYGFDVVAIHGRDPHGEVTFLNLENAMDYARKHTILTVFNEPQLDSPGIRRIADSLVAEIMILNPLEVPLHAEGTYLTEMYHNLDALKHGLLCE